MKQIFPKEIIENFSVVYQFKNSQKSKVIYLVILSAFIGILISLPFLKVKIYSTARGVIKPNKERVALNVIISGKIEYSRVLNNQSVKKGDTLLVIDNLGIDDLINLSDYQLNETAQFIVDLTVLLESQMVHINVLQSSKYKVVFLQYSQKLVELETRHRKTKRAFERSEILYSKGVISKSELEDKQFEFDLNFNKVNQFKKRQQNLWQVDLTNYQNQLQKLYSGKDQLLKSKNQFVVIAPIDGTLLNVLPQELGGFISAGTQFGEISPNTELLVECYIKPSDIGLLRKNTKIKFQLDAYNYNQWGYANGEIIGIGKDIELIDNQPVFRIRCKLKEKFLKLKNGFQGNLKKGMTLNANFEITQRSISELLYDKMDDWLNPNRKEMAEL